MKIEIGKYYKRRDGKTAGPMQFNPSDKYPFKDPRHGITYPPSGNPFGFHPMYFDLVEVLPELGTLVIEEGKYYKQRDGIVLGPAISNKLIRSGERVWTLPHKKTYYLFHDDGSPVLMSSGPFERLIKEVPKPEKS